MCVDVGVNVSVNLVINAIPQYGNLTKYNNYNKPSNPIHHPHLNASSTSLSPLSPLASSTSPLNLPIAPHILAWGFKRPWSFWVSITFPETLSLPDMKAFCALSFPVTMATRSVSSRVRVTSGLIPLRGAPS